MDCYKIAGWSERYEVDSKGRPASADLEQEKLRKKPLDFVRLQVYGLRQGPAYRRLMKKGWQLGAGMDLAAFGLFCKLLEIAADQPRQFRGWILDEKQRPVGIDDIAELIGTPDTEIVARLLKLLADPDIAWLEITVFGGENDDSGGLFEKTPSFPETPGIDGVSMEKFPSKLQTLPHNETETEHKHKQNETETKTPTDNCASAHSRRGSPQEPKTKRQAESSVSTSDFSNDVSVSASNDFRIKQKRELARIEILGKMPVKPDPRDRVSDKTTVDHILAECENRAKDGRSPPEIFDDLVAMAAECRAKGRNPWAMFIAAAKERFSYEPRRQRLCKR